MLELSVGDVLRLLGTGATASIVVALGGGPLRTKRLTTTVPDCTARTVYRHAARLTELGIVERFEEPGVPSRVLYRLANPAGRALFHLLETYAGASTLRASSSHENGQWSSLGLIAELWDSGLMTELSRGARSPTELSTAPCGLTFHQANRRAQLFKAGGLLFEEPGRGRIRRYGLTHSTRRAIGLVTGIARWRRRYGAPEGSAFGAAEIAAVLQIALPLIELPAQEGMTLKLGVAGPLSEGRLTDGETLLMEVSEQGRLRRMDEVRRRADAWALATVNTWFASILDDRRGRMRTGGDVELVESCLSGLHRAVANPIENNGDPSSLMRVEGSGSDGTRTRDLRRDRPAL